MSVIVAVKASADTSAFRKSLEERADEYRKMAGRGREKGALYHRFAIGDGSVLISDEWESAAAFEKLFCLIRSYRGSSALSVVHLEHFQALRAGLEGRGFPASSPRGRQFR